AARYACSAAAGFRVRLNSGPRSPTLSETDETIGHSFCHASNDVGRSGAWTGKLMPTFGEMLSGLDARLFVGRQRELDIFRAWLTAENRGVGVLNISGPGGVGKSTLLRAFRRIAEEMGRSVVAVDGRLFRATSAGLLQMLGGTELPAVVEQLNQARPLLVFDTFEELENLTPFLRDDFLPQLDFNVPIVIAGRRPM